MINLKSIPFLRILFPYVLGIAACLQFGFFKTVHLLFFIGLLCLLSAFLFLRFYKPFSSLKKPLYLLCTHCFLFLLAFESVFLYQAKNDPEHYSHYILREAQDLTAIVEDMPVASEKFIRLPLQITGIKKDNSWYPVNGKTVLYLRKEGSTQFDIGNTLYIRSTFSYVNAPKNPGEFDYKTFLEERNIYHILYASPKDLRMIKDPQQSFSITRLGAAIKANVIEVLRSNGLSQEAFSICAALLVGYDDEIESSVMQSFSHSGTLHILSVSGMHTGILYAILIWIFAKVDKYDRRKKLKCFFVILSLFLFVLITGFSPSVLRAALMLSLVITGRTFYKEGNSYNTLLVSAFMLLLVNPYLIKDAGFLLSYFAVFGIMYFYPTLHKLYTFKNRILQFFWTSALLSVAATLFTLPISLYFFHQFPLWFILSNIVIIPLSIILMGAAIALVGLCKIGLLKTALVYIINTTTSWMLGLARLTDEPGLGYIDAISFSKTDALFCSLLIFLFLIVLVLKQYRQVVYFAAVCIAWLGFSIHSNYTESRQHELVVFHVKQKSVFALRLGHQVYADFSDLSDKEFQRFVKPYLLNFSGLEIIPVKSNLVRTPKTEIALVRRPGISFSGLSPAHFIVSRDVTLEIPVNTVKNKAVVIADCSNSYKFVQQLKKECALKHTAFYSIKENGALTLNLD